MVLAPPVFTRVSSFGRRGAILTLLVGFALLGLLLFLFYSAVADFGAFEFEFAAPAGCVFVAGAMWDFVPDLLGFRRPRHSDLCVWVAGVLWVICLLWRGFVMMGCCKDKAL